MTRPQRNVAAVLVWPVIAQWVIAWVFGTSLDGLVIAIAANLVLSAILVPMMYRR